MQGNRATVKGVATLNGTNEVTVVWEESYAASITVGDFKVLDLDKIGIDWQYLSYSLETLTRTAGMNAVASAQIMTAMRMESGLCKEGDGTELDVMIDANSATETADLSAVGNTYGPRSVTLPVLQAADPTITLDAEYLMMKITGNAASDGTVRVRMVFNN